MTKDPKKDAAYFEAIGRFIVSYAKAELQMVGAMGRVLGIGNTKAQAAFSGLRGVDLSERLRRLIGSSEGAADADACLTQLRIIGDLRNRIVHWELAITPDGQHAIAQNRLLVKAPDLLEKYRIPVKSITEAESDCTRIAWRLSVLRNDFWTPSDEWRAELNAPWLYKHLEPIRKKARDRVRPQSRSRPHQSSRE